MKKLLTALGVAALLAGCASQDNSNRDMGGTSEDTMKTDSIHSTGNGGSQDDNSGFNTATGTNNATGQSQP